MNHSNSYLGANMNRDIYTFPKNNFQHIKMTLSEFEGQVIFDLRVYGEKPDGTVYPTKQGLRLAASHLLECDNALQAAIRELALNDTPTAQPARFSVRSLVSSAGQRLRSSGARVTHPFKRRDHVLDAYETTGSSPPANATGDREIPVPREGPAPEPMPATESDEVDVPD
jgi:Transcriptional Coactivator p15 (PC4)